MKNIIKRISNRVKNIFLKRRNLFGENKDEKEARIILRQELNKVNLDNESTSGWISNQKNLKNLINSSDPRNFLNWPIVTYTMFHVALKDEWTALKKSPRFEMYKKNLNEDKVGNPYRYEYSMNTSGNLVHHLYSIEQLFLNIPDFNISQMNSVVEFGGGYGSLCRLFYRLGLKGKYYTFDFPIFHLIQKYFISLSSIKNNSDKIYYNESIESIPENPDLFVSLWAISESPVNLRDKFFEKINKTRYILIGYQDNFEGIDNLSYFKSKRGEMSQFSWKDYKIKHLPGNNYLIGIRKD